MSAALRSFLQGSQLGGGKASGAIAKNMSLFGENPNAGPGSEMKLNPMQSAVRSGIEDLANLHADKAGEDYTDPDTGMTVAQPGALSEHQQAKVNLFSKILKDKAAQGKGIDIASLFGGM